MNHLGYRVSSAPKQREDPSGARGRDLYLPKFLWKLIEQTDVPPFFKQRRALFPKSSVRKVKIRESINVRTLNPSIKGQANSSVIENTGRSHVSVM